MKALMTGGAGCIGSELAAVLCARGDEVTIVDNFSSGREEHIAGMPVRVIRADLLDRPELPGADIVWHLAANPDVRGGGDFEQNLAATRNVLDSRPRAVVFTSTSAVYGMPEVEPIPETHPLRPISMYGATKAGAEALLSAYTHLAGARVWILRLANIVGAKTRRRGRTVISDFIHKLRENPQRLEILGDGRQAKSYLTVGECIEGMLAAVEKAREPLNVFNLGGPDQIRVTRIAEIVAEAMGLGPVEFVYTGGSGGWPGDVPHFVLDSSKLGALGWRARLNSEASIRDAVRAALAASP